MGSHLDVGSNPAISTIHMHIRRKSAKRDFRRAVGYSSVDIYPLAVGVRTRPVLTALDLTTRCLGHESCLILANWCAGVW